MTNRIRTTGYLPLDGSRGKASVWVAAAKLCTLETEHSAVLCIRYLYTALERRTCEVWGDLHQIDRANDDHEANVRLICNRWPNVWKRVNRLHRGYRPLPHMFAKQAEKARRKRMTKDERRNEDMWREVRELDRAEAERLAERPLAMWPSERRDYTGEASL